MTLKIQVLAWDRHKNVAGLNLVMGSQHSPLNNWIRGGVGSLILTISLDEIKENVKIIDK